ncbi:response regulator transcription factor [Pseudonocardia eucalypti]|uniref:Response regulator transcription factor n=1 Tax=Pseudonocardia eucalypti TaxID=648755 RepID=A0ABP9RCX5_9PSEU|nr:DNA-binding response OmpR family regulator [Pseudonocardia eucalypti]
MSAVTEVVTTDVSKQPSLRKRAIVVGHGEPTTSSVLAALDSSGYQVVICRASCAVLARNSTADIVLLDLGIPDVDGYSFLAELRSSSSVPILAYSRRTDADAVVEALQRGADDYMVEPMRPRELIARVNALCRRVATDPLDEVLSVGDIEIHVAARVVATREKLIHLTPRESEIVAVLARNTGKVVGREEIMCAVWGRASTAVSRNLDVHIATIRGKLARPNLLLTVRGCGYRLGHSRVSEAHV